MSTMHAMLNRPAVAVLSAAALAAALAVGGCAPIRMQNGYQAIEHQPKDVKVGVDTRSTVLENLGSPSLVSTFDANTWYYMNQQTNQMSFHGMQVRRRNVTAITFDKDKETVTEVKNYTLRDGKIIAFNGRETPTRGRELSVLEQLLGNIGRGSMLPQTDPTPGQRPGQ